MSSMKSTRAQALVMLTLANLLAWCPADAVDFVRSGTLTQQPERR
jgi:hypothetical protein